MSVGYEGEDFTRALKDRLLKFIIGVRVTTKISIEREERIAIEKYLATLTDNNFEFLIENNQEYFHHTMPCRIRGIGKVRLVLSYAYCDEENIRCYITNLDEGEETLIKLLIKRWRIECFNRDAKQHLGLEAYQLRKGCEMQIVALACLIAYTLSNLLHASLKHP